METYLGKCSCIYCKEVKSVKGIFVHVDRTHLNSKKYSSGNNGKYKEISDAAFISNIKKKEDYLCLPNRCVTCSSILEYEKRNNKHCSHSCSAIATNQNRDATGWTLSDDSRRKIAEKLTGKIYYKVPIEEIHTCPECNKPFTVVKKHKSSKVNKFCSRACSAISNSRVRALSSRENKTAWQNYKKDSSFKFDLKDYTLEFDFTLVEQFGWYKAKNRGDNPTGVSRDHMISVRYGFDNGIDSAIISHPANCKLMQQHNNASKNMRCSITLVELNKRIEKWECKYRKS